MLKKQHLAHKLPYTSRPVRFDAKGRRSVAVVTCLNNANLGMYSVDAAALDFFHSIGMQPTLFCAHTPPRRSRARIWRATGLNIGNRRLDRVGRLKKRLLDDFRILEQFDLVCYWGDFTTNPVWLERSFPLCEAFSEIDGDSLSRRKRWEKLFSGDAHHPLKISFGQNFQHPSLVNDPVHRTMLRETLEGMKGVFPRDSKSTDNVRTIMGDCGQRLVTVLDCAFFLNPLEYLSHPRKRDGVFGYFFGRSGFSHNVQKRLIAQIEAATGLAALHIGEWLSSAGRSIEGDFSRCISRLQSCDFVVTDTYHLSINSLREGVMPIVVSKVADEQYGTLGDYKKKALLNDIGLLDLHVEWSEEDDEQQGIDRTVDSVLRNHGRGSDKLAGWQETIVARIAHDRAMFSEFVDGLLTK